MVHTNAGLFFIVTLDLITRPETKAAIFESEQGLYEYDSNTDTSQSSSKEEDMITNLIPTDGRGFPSPWINFNRPTFYSMNAADIRIFPYTVSILRKGQPVGVGALLNCEYVITTAYTAHGNISEFHIRAGSISPFYWGHKRKVVEKRVHEEYQQDWRHNVALLKLDKPLQESIYVQFISITAVYRVPETSVVLGFGSEELKFPQGQVVLKFARVRAKMEDECSLLFGDLPDDYTSYDICTSSTHRGPCTYNFGAPMITNLRKLQGLFLGTDECYSDKALGVYKNLFFYRYWIKLQTGIE